MSDKKRMKTSPASGSGENDENELATRRKRDWGRNEPAMRCGRDEMMKYGAITKNDESLRNRPVLFCFRVFLFILDYQIHH